MNSAGMFCPKAGNGVHRWLLSQANRCRNLHRSPEQTFSELRDASRECGRTVPDREIWDAIGTAFTGSRRSLNSTWMAAAQRRPRWPAVDHSSIDAASNSGFGLADLRAGSPTSCEEFGLDAEAIIDTLFPGDPFLCVGWRSAKQASTVLRSVWRGRLCGASLIVPSPMTAPLGRTKAGRVSPRCLGNVGPRHFLVIEFDNGSIDTQAARLWNLARMAPLTLVVHSGNKSLHGWFWCRGIEESRVRQFMEHCVRIGADPATWTPCQLVRMPGGVREGNLRQPVVYFNPGILLS